MKVTTVGNVRIAVGGVTAHVVSATGNTATFIVPAGVHLGPARVTATNPGGPHGKGPIGSRLSNFFDKSAFCAPPIVGAINGVGGATGYGNIALDPVLGPGQFNWDMSIHKKMGIGRQTESSVLEFRADIFNTFNHPQFSNPASNAGAASTFGVITTTSTGPRIIQLALRYSF